MIRTLDDDGLGGRTLGQATPSARARLSMPRREAAVVEYAPPP